MMRCANIKKASQAEQQNQTTTKTNYIKNFISVLKHKNLITKSKERQITDIKQNNLYTTKNRGLVSKKKLGTIRQ